MSIVVKAKKGESTDSIIKRFQKKVLLEGLQKELQNRRYYQKPSQVKQDRLKERRRKIKEYQRKKYGRY